MLSSTDNSAAQRPAIAEAKIIDGKLLNLLIKTDELNRASSDRILEESDFDSETPGWRLVLAGVITERRWSELVADLFGLMAAEVSDFTIDDSLLAVVPEQLASRYKLIPLTRAASEVYIGISNPTSLSVFDHLRTLLDCELSLVVLPPSQIEGAIQRHYIEEDVDELAHIDASSLEHIEVSDFSELSEHELRQLQEGGESGKIIELVDRLFTHAINIGASDIHIEPSQKILRIRFRVDGLLRSGPVQSIVLAPLVVSRIKVLAKLDIAERYVPQDGRVRTRLGGAEVDMRVSCMPVASGEKVVVRLLGHERLSANLSGLGIRNELLRDLRKHIHAAQGMILITGPTGSGKSTTMYAALQDRTSDELNVVTLEDPIEYELPELNQVPVNPKRGVTFPVALRAILRQDPDVIMLGEIRDTETGVIAAEAAVTGHLLLSTLHTNDAASAVHRLLELGVPKYLVAPSLQCVLAQRLVRATCVECVEQYEADREELEGLVPGGGLESITLAAGRGCAVCDGSGYAGRIGIHELLNVTDEIRALIGRRATTLEIRDCAMSQGMRDLRTSALELVFTGQTSVAEFHRVVGH